MQANGNLNHRKYERGQVAPLLAVFLVVVLLSVALAVDVGYGYVTKARLTKAVDAACLTAMKNLAQGQTTARTLAINSFNANYGASSLDSAPPTVSVGFSTGSTGNILVNVTATAANKTVFMGILPDRRTLSVGDNAQATRGKLIMSLVVDRSGSEQSDGGSTALPPAATSFINYFDNANDEVALVSYGSNATVDVPIEYNFITPITSAVNSINWGGGTFGPGGLTLAKAQIDSVPVLTGQNVVKVVVYFTDGYVNTIQDTFNCTSTLGATLYNYGGYDSGSNVDFFNPTNGTDWGGVDTNGNPPHTPTPDCTGVTTFTSQFNGQQKSFTRSNVTTEAKARALATANTMLAEGTYVYSIGLGTNVDQTFLKQIANDPGSPTFNASLPQGAAFFASNCPSSSCTAEMQQLFQTIASRILLRLTQ